MLMNEYQKKLFNDLEKLVENREEFYNSEVNVEGRLYRIYNYRLASYSSFLEDGALECRGTMFEVDSNGNAVNLVALQIHKFFNIFENPITMNLDLNMVVRIMEKKDGSLIGSYLSGDKIKLKSKGSLTSDQALDAMEYLKHNVDLLELIRDLESQNLTVNMEWCSVKNRIVLNYTTPHLSILNVRSKIDGTYLNIHTGDNAYVNHPTMVKYRVDSFSHDDPATFLASVPDMSESIEGFVCEMEDGTFFKIKTLAYLTLHKSKDSINSPRRLYEAVLYEATDDLRSLFHDDPVAISLIAEMEEKVDKLYNHVVDTVEKFYAANKDSERKEYAIAGQKELDKKFFGLAMNLYLGNDFSYKEFMVKRWKDFGIKDVEKVEE